MQSKKHSLIAGEKAKWNKYFARLVWWLILNYSETFTQYQRGLVATLAAERPHCGDIFTEKVGRESSLGKPRLSAASIGKAGL